MSTSPSIDPSNVKLLASTTTPSLMEGINYFTTPVSSKFLSGTDAVCNIMDTPLPKITYVASSTGSSSSEDVKSMFPTQSTVSNSTSVASLSSTLMGGNFANASCSVGTCESISSHYEALLSKHTRLLDESERLALVFADLASNDEAYPATDRALKCVQRQIEVVENIIKSLQTKKESRQWLLTGVKSGPNFASGLSQNSTTALCQDIEKLCTLPDPLSTNLQFNVDKWESDYFKLLFQYYARDTGCLSEHFEPEKQNLALRFSFFTYKSSTTDVYKESQEHSDARKASWSTWTNLLRKVFNQPIMLHDSLTHVRHIQMMNNESVESWLSRIDSLLKMIPMEPLYKKALQYETVAFSMNNDIKFWLIPEFLSMHLNGNPLIGYLPMITEKGIQRAKNFASADYKFPEDSYNPLALIHLIRQEFKSNCKDKLNYESSLMVKTNPTFKPTSFLFDKSAPSTPTKIPKKESVQHVSEHKSHKRQPSDELNTTQKEWYKPGYMDIVIEKNKGGNDFQPLAAFTITRPYTIHTLPQVPSRDHKGTETNSQFEMITLSTKKINNYYKLHNVRFVKPTCNVCVANKIEYTTHPTEMHGRYFRYATPDEQRNLKVKQLQCIAKPSKN